MQRVLMERISQILEESKAKIKKVKDREKELEHALHQTELSIAKDYIPLSVYQADLKQKQNEIDALQKESRKIETESGQSHALELTKIVQNFQKKTEEYDATIKQKSKNIESLKKALEESRDQIFCIESSLKFAKEEARAASNKIFDLETRESHLQKSKEESEAQIEQLKLDVEALTKELNSTKSTLTLRENELRRTKETLTQVQSENTKLTDEIEYQLKRIDDLTGSLQTLEKNHEDDQSRISELEENSSNLKQLLAASENEITELKRDVMNLNNEKQSLESVIEGKTEKINSLEERISELMKARKLAITELASKVAELKEQMLALAEVQSAAKGQFSSYVQSSLQEFIKFVVRQVTEKNSQVEEAQRVSKELMGQNDTLQRQKRECETTIQDLTLKNTAQICFYTAEIQKIKETAKHELEALKNAHNQEIQSYREQLEIMKQRIQETVENYEYRLKMQSNTHQDEISNFKARIAQNESTVANLQLKLDNAQKERAKYETQIQEWFTVSERYESKLREKDFQLENEANKSRIEREKIQLLVLEKCNQIEALERQIVRLEREAELHKEQLNGLVNEKNRSQHVITKLKKQLTENTNQGIEQSLTVLNENTLRNQLSAQRPKPFSVLPGDKENECLDAKESVDEFRLPKGELLFGEKIMKGGRKEQRSPILTSVNTSFDILNELANSHFGKMVSLQAHDERIARNPLWLSK